MRRDARLVAAGAALAALTLSACRPSAGSGGSGAATTKPSSSSGSSTTSASASSPGRSGSGAGSAEAVPPLEGPLLDLWTRANAGEGDDLARLADREGAGGLVARASADDSYRLTAVRAAAFLGDPGAFEALPWLARIAAGGDEAEASAALESATDLAARPRRAVDPEDAEELREGCDRLLALAKDATAPRPRRVASVRALRMLADRGCVKPGDLPADLDAK